MNETRTRREPVRKARNRSAIFYGPEKLAIAESALPPVGPREVRVGIEGCGVCASNLPVWEGRAWFEYPFEAGAPGHEGWGVVDQVGGEVSDFRPGDRVTLLSYHAFAAYDTAPQEQVVKLPDSLAGPFPGEPLGCAVNIAHRSDFQKGQTVAVIGAGFIGSLLVALAARAGARVIAISRRTYALETAKTMGASHTIALRDSRAVVQEVFELTNGKGCERVIEAVGEQWPLDLAGDLTAERGRLVIAGYHQDGRRTVNMQLWNWRGIDVINAHERSAATYLRGIREAVDLVASGELDPYPLYTHKVPLGKLSGAFALMRDRPDGFMKALVTM